MHQEPYPIFPIRPKDTIAFQCQLCGKCCQHLSEQLMLEPLDAYRLARHFNQEGDVAEIDEILDRYAEPVPLSEGYPVYVVKTKAPEETCIFYESGRCSIYAARPRTCKIYPITAAPGTRGKDFDYYLCGDKKHHLTGDKISVKEWLYQNFSQDDREYLKLEFEYTPLLGLLIRNMDSDKLKQAIFPLLYYRYYHYDLDQPFLPQFRENMHHLLENLQEMCNPG